MLPQGSVGAGRPWTLAPRSLKLTSSKAFAELARLCWRWGQYPAVWWYQKGYINETCGGLAVEPWPVTEASVHQTLLPLWEKRHPLPSQSSRLTCAPSRAMGGAQPLSSIRNDFRRLREDWDNKQKLLWESVINPHLPTLCALVSRTGSAATSAKRIDPCLVKNYQLSMYLALVPKTWVKSLAFFKKTCGHRSGIHVLDRSMMYPSLTICITLK